MDNQNSTSNPPPTTENIPAQNPVVQQTPPSQAYPAPQSPPPSSKSFFSTKIILLIVFLLILLGAGGTYLALNSKPKPQPIVSKPTPTSAPTPIPTGDPAANWKTYTGKVLSIKFQVPKDWEVSEQEGGYLNYGDYGKINTTITAKDPKRSFSIIKNFFGGFAGLDLIEERGIYVGSEKAKASYLRESSGYSQIQIRFTDSYKNYLIIYGYGKTDSEADKIFNQILSTFQFTN